MGGNSNHKKLMIFRLFARIAGCVQSFILGQKCTPRSSEFWPKSHISARATNKIYLNMYVSFYQVFSLGVSVPIVI